MLAIVCWHALRTGVPIYSQPMPHAEALRVFHHGAQPGTSMPCVLTEDTEEYRLAIAAAQKEATK